MPGGMCEWGVEMVPGTWVVNEDHQGDCGAAEHIK